MSDYEIMEISIMKNIQELSELCVDYRIKNAYDLMEVVSRYCETLEKAKTNGVYCIPVDLKESEEE